MILRGLKPFICIKNVWGNIFPVSYLMENNAPAKRSVPHRHHDVVDWTASKINRRGWKMSSAKGKKSVHLNMQWTLSVLYPASSFLNHINIIKLGCRLSRSHLPRVRTWSPNLRPAMAAGLPGTTRDTNTPLLWAETRRPTWSEGEWGNGDIIAIEILCRDHPCRGRPISRARDWPQKATDGWWRDPEQWFIQISLWKRRDYLSIWWWGLLSKLVSDSWTHLNGQKSFTFGRASLGNFFLRRKWKHRHNDTDSNSIR